MFARGLRLIVATVCLLNCTAGCHAFPPASPTARQDSRYSDGDEDDGWLFDRLTGRKADESQRDPSTGVTQAMAVEPVSPPQGFDAPAPSAAAIGADSEFSDDKPSGYQLEDFYPANVVDTVKRMTGNGPNEQLARALYKEGEALYRQERYEDAASRLDTAAARAPDSPLEEDALFLLAESRFFADQYPKANDAYEELLKKYEYTRHLDKVVARLFAIGRYWEQLDAAQSSWSLPVNVTDSSRPTFDAWGNALKAYQSVRMHDPTGPLADDSVMATANAHFLKGRYEDAAYNYDLLRKEYPKSEYQLQAHLLAMKSKEKIYQGPMYDGAPLDEAGEIADQTLTQFGPDLGTQRDMVLQARNRVVEQKAERDWTIAQYYDKKKCFGAARYYYRFITKDYPLTAIARKAEARLEEIKDLPAEPANHFKWLTDRFGSGAD